MKHCYPVIYIHTISGGTVNFGGAIYVAPISITTSTSSSSSTGTSSAGASLGAIAGGILK